MLVVASCLKVDDNICFTVTHMQLNIIKTDYSAIITKLFSMSGHFIFLFSCESKWRIRYTCTRVTANARSNH